MSQKHSFYAIWDIFKPFVIYYVLYSAVFILLISLCGAIAQGLGTGYQAYLTEHVETVTGLVSGLSMIISILPLLPMLRRELAAHRLIVGNAEENISYDGGKAVKNGNAIENAVENATGDKAEKRKRGISIWYIMFTVILAASSSVGLNILLALTNLVESSASYQDVAQQQYGVMFGAGMILFGLISPITEEIVFRGLVFNRMRRYFPHAAAVVVSGVLFGIYHGNLVQGLYGGCMGILMAYLYERMHSFFIPYLFHATANLIVYIIAQNAALHGLIFTVPGCVAFLLISVGCVGMIECIFVQAERR